MYSGVEFDLFLNLCRACQIEAPGLRQMVFAFFRPALEEGRKASAYRSYLPHCRRRNLQPDFIARRRCGCLRFHWVAFGRIKIGSKTLEGSIGCCLLCLVLGVFVFPELPGFLEGWGGELSLVQVLVLSFAVSLLELVPFKIPGVEINDNLYVPAVTSAIAFLIR